MTLRPSGERPEPGHGEVLLELVAVGLCGSDYSLYLGKHPLSQFPQTQGHEMAARVVSHGPGTQAIHPVGSQVAVEPLLPCGRCYPCRIGRGNCCVDLRLFGVHEAGGLQPFLAVPEHLVHEAGGMPPEVAAFSEPMSIALQALRRGGIGPDDKVLVTGAGPVGQAAIIAAVEIGARVAASDLVPERLDRARSSGAEITLDPREGLDDAVAAWTDGEGPTLIIEASGAPMAIRSAVQVVAAAGRIVLVGISDQEVSLPIAAFTRKEMTVLGARNSVGIFAEAVRIVRDNQEKVQRLITHRISLEQVEETIRLALKHPDIVEKAVVISASTA